ncbi:NAD(P)-dependent oxidoreductase [Halorubrum sp. CGM4_25_10-8A]|uniref:SDR family oxidoreductase n=1 Tax=Halorubrum sp. CGM4_25_10-8A TaxID=2518116 RepID=UPI0010F7082F|nr:NAD(P)-dependent oxidoreductase [Halorubrum sp. CGM4_25_10-8A]TKX41345.1 NAD(P)-dependent oxidoreductase [Halorubrum sp. CGM4_25_10-8A]
MRLLVVGSNGLLGSNVIHEAREREWEVHGTYHSSRPSFDIPLSQFSLESFAAFDELLAKHDPDVVINCAAMTDVDSCEQNPDQALVLNGEAPGELAARCERTDTEFVHVSTDYVFDGSIQTRYDESVDPNPIQTYGESKLAGEQSVQENHASALIPRLSFVWGIHRSTGELTGFPSWVRNQLRSGETVPLFTDQWITPTRAGQAAETILDLIVENAAGTHHVACRSCVTPHEFGELLAEQVGVTRDQLLEGSTTDVERDAERPSHSCLAVGTVEEVLGRPQPTLSDDIDAVWDLVE